jgi:Nucleotidyl transferase AbiEii toxin, Type IV TA system
MFQVEPDGVLEWIGASPTGRGVALAELLGLADAFPQSRRFEGSPSLVDKVIAVDRALSAADLPHAFGGGLALAYYGEPRVTIDIDVNLFVPVDRWPEVEGALEPLPIDLGLDPKELTEERQARLPWDLNPVHLFFSYDDLHAEMPRAIRRVPFAETEIPIVAPEHLVIRKAMLDRPKDWLDIEAIFVASGPLDLDTIETWVRRLAGAGDHRITKLQELARRTR